MQTLLDRRTGRPVAAPCVPDAAAPAAVSAVPPRAATGRGVLRGGAVVLALRGLAMGPALLVAIGLARLLGKAGFGAYQTAVAWLFVLAVPAGLGIERLVVQRLAADRARGDWGAVRGLLRACTVAVLAAALLTTAVAVGVALLLPALADAEGLWLAFATLPAMALLRLAKAALQGFEHVVEAQLGELVLVPVLSLAGLAVAWLCCDTLTVTDAFAILLAAHLLALGTALGQLWRRLPWRELRAQPPVYRLAEWGRAAAPMLLLAALLVVNARTDVVLLGAFAGPEEVGPYVAALRCAGLIGMVLMAANAALAPAVARLHATGERAELQAVLTRTARWTAAVGAVGAAVFVVFGAPLLAIFGDGFVAARPALTILSLSQALTVCVCAPILVLTMTGHARVAAWGLAVGAAVSVALDVALIPWLGGTGAALGNAAGALGWVFGLAFVTRRLLGLDLSLLGRRP